MVKGKNIGRANETTALQQAEREAEAKYKLKSSQVELPSPMLAQVYPAAARHMVFPCFVQPKLDGVRGVYDPVNNIIYSRLGNPFPHLDHILKDLQGINIRLDGELYSETMSFEALAGLVKKQTYDEAILQVRFHIFDCIIPMMSFEDRLNELRQLPKKLKIVETVVCLEEDIDDMLEHYIARGYEGIMLRNAHGLYVHKRSKDLQKFKQFLDDEFEIIGFTRENNSDAIIWQCKTTTGQTFDVKPTGALENRSQTDQEARALIGKQLTVKYQELTDKKVPRFPVGLGFFRD